MPGELLKKYSPDKIDQAWGSLMEQTHISRYYPPVYLERLRQTVEIVHFAYRTTVFEGSTLPKKRYMVLAGGVRIIQPAITIQSAGKGDYFGGGDIVSITYRQQMEYQAIVSSKSFLETYEFSSFSWSNTANMLAVVYSIV